ncbi:MAG TPA: sulfotransferase [Thermoanaerobaculia bacterium]|nr:sulfotransferase [Thermoanaerobaculia bacterium]
MPQSYIFLFAPMRSGSTLLTFLLCSHPEILGYGETHVVYRSPEDLEELVARVCRAHGKERPERRYVLDKQLHNGLLRRPDCLVGADVSCLFLLREPRRTLRSIVHQLDSTWDDAFTYYEERVAALASYVAHFPRNAFLTYERLVGEPEQALAGLTDFLGLSAPLSPEYELQPLHDQKGVGDRSETILAGKILANPRELTVELPEDRLAAAEAAYLECKSALAKDCLTL